MVPTGGAGARVRAARTAVRRVRGEAHGGSVLFESTILITRCGDLVSFSLFVDTSRQRCTTLHAEVHVACTTLHSFPVPVASKKVIQYLIVLEAACECTPACAPLRQPCRHAYMHPRTRAVAWLCERFRPGPKAARPPLQPSATAASVREAGAAAAAAAAEEEEEGEAPATARASAPGAA